MSEVNYFEQRQSSYESNTAKQTRENVLTRRLQVSGAHKQYVISVPRSIVKCLNLHEQDLLKIRLDNDSIVMKKVNLDNE
jgi:hypothetical protein